MLSVVAASGAIFGGQALYFHEPLAADAFFAWLDVFMAAHLLMLMCGLIDLHGGKIKKPLYALIAMIGVSLVATHSLTGCQVVLSRGLAMCTSGSLADSVTVAAYLVVMITSLYFSRWLIRKEKTHIDFYWPDKLISLSVVAAFVFIYMNLMAAIFRNGPLFLVGLAALLVHLVLLVTGTIAKNNYDSEIAARPFNFFRRSLVLKVSMLSAGLFWLLIVVVSIVTISFFTQTIVAYRDTTIGHRISELSGRFEEQQSVLLQAAGLAAADPMSLSAVASGSLPSAVKEMADSFRSRGVDPIVRILDANGTVLLGGVSERGATLPSAGVVGLAIQGLKTAAFEWDNMSDRPVLRAAVPARFDDGSGGILLVAAEFVLSPGLFSDAALPPTSYGLVTAEGEPIMAVGQALSEQEVQPIKKVPSGDRVSLFTLADGSIIGFRPLHSSEGGVEGYFYLFLNVAVTGTSIMRLYATALFLDLLALIVMTLFLFWSERSLLRPVGELRAAARAIEYEDYSVRIKYDSPDELGEMAGAFNKMSQTIAERTVSLRNALREQTDFLANTAHEILTPLNVIRWTLDMMRLGDTGRLTKEQMELLEQMHQTASRLAGLVQNLIEAAKMEQGKITLKKAVMPVEDIIDEVAGLLSIKAREKGIVLQWKHPQEPLPSVNIDHDRIHQVVLNLMNNAVKYTGQKGQVTVTAAETDQVSPDGSKGRFIQVSIQDNGRGIPKDDQSRIFSRFFRAANVVKDDLEGAGLGLFIVSKLVELHGGRVWFKSEEGVGSTFNFTIPIDKK
jgi:signal transduction histidine kinase